MLDDQTTAAPRIAMPQNKPRWILCLTLHSSLMRAYVTDEKRKADLATRLKSKIQSIPANSPVRPQILSLHVRNRKGEPEPLVQDSLMQEYAVLTKRQKYRRLAIRRLEKLILAAQPKSHGQAVLLLDFLSGMVATRRRFNRRDVAAVMRRCTETMARLTQQTGSRTAHAKV